MVRPNRAAAIEKYREKLLTNPDTFRAKLEKVREDLRDRSELMFIDRDLADADNIEDLSEAQIERRDKELTSMDNMIISIGQRVEAIDEVLAADKKSQAELFTLGKKAKAHREKQLKEQRGMDVKTLTDPVVPVEGEEETQENE
jgi:hypothetical protein